MELFEVSYRREFSATVEAANLEDAKKKFKNGEVEIKCVGELQDEFFKVDGCE